MTNVPVPLTARIIDQIQKAGLPQGGAEPLRPKLGKNKRGEVMIEKAFATWAPRGKATKKGWVDDQGHIWIRDYAHAGVPDHRDVQIRGGQPPYIRVDLNGNLLP